MDRIWHLKPHLRHVVLSPERAFIIGERQRFMLSGRGVSAVLPFIDGRRTEREIIVALERVLPAPEVLYALMQLAANGHLTQTLADLPPERAAYWSGHGVEPPGRGSAGVVSVLALGPDPARELIVDAIHGAGLRVAERAALTLVSATSYLDPALAVINQAQLDAGAPWLLVRPVGLSLLVGPHFQPGKGPCWACLADRLRRNRPVESYCGRSLASSEPITAPRPGLPATEQIALHMAAVSAAHILAEASSSLADTIHELDPAHMRITPHRVVRRPQCPSCGQPGRFAEQASAPVRLRSQVKAFTADGGHRCRSPAETYERLADHISPLTGIVSSLGPIPGRHHEMRQVFGATYFLPPLAGSAARGFELVAMGKGRSFEQARAGAVCEAIERWSALSDGTEPTRRGCFRELAPAAIDPDTLQNFSAAQRQGSSPVHVDPSDMRQVLPPTFDPDQVIDWAPAWSLVDDSRRYLPASYCYSGFDAPANELVCNHNPNGHAAGNCLEEAILQAFLELVERDGTALWWYNRARRPAVDIFSFGEPWFERLVSHYDDLGRDLWVLDLTTDLELPTFVAVARSRANGRIDLGLGCHLDARMGVSRALTELNQLFDPSEASPPAFDPALMPSTAFLQPGPGTPRGRGDYANLATTPRTDLRDDVLECVRRAQHVGLDVIVLDMTRPDVGLHCVKVCVPGLRHFWPRLGPGRLYDVPARIGWVDTALTEAQLNPIPLLL